MTKILLIVIFFLAHIFSVRSQTLYSTTPNGGTGGGGTINKFIPSTRELTSVKSFETTVSTPYYTGFIQANDGKLYGMASGGGSEGRGAIFSYDPSSSTYAKVKDFENITGTNPLGSLVQASNGKLYGTTSTGGGSIGLGVIFSFDPSTLIYTKLKDFENNTDGAIPTGSLVQAGDGKLYGTARGGDYWGYGVIFSFDSSNSTYARLYDFDKYSGANPGGDLIQAKDGKLYGITNYGGSTGYGVIFSFDPSSSIYTKLKDFDYSSADGNPGSLIQGRDGKLYGMTIRGGTNGAVFSFNPLDTAYTVLKYLDGINGGNPGSGLIQADDGKLYGMTSAGGSSADPSSTGYGVIFSIDPLDAAYAIVKDFDYTSGGGPTGRLFQARDGNLYGLTSIGGINGYGIIFSYEPKSFRYTVLKDLGEIESANPLGNLMQANNGKLYGMTLYGTGQIYSLDPSALTYTKLRDFGFNDGNYPTGSLIQANDGKLYGMTALGGASTNSGVIFSFNPLSGKYVETTFDGTNGNQPHGSLLQASDGLLYGMTLGGGTPYFRGVIFSFDPASSAYKKLFDFDGNNGANPYGSLIQAKNGKLYGMTSSGNNLYSGVIFSFDPSSNTYTKLKDFDYKNGANPLGSLLQASDGKLYGMTSVGGSHNVGVIFSFDPASSVFLKLMDFDSIDGAGPQGSLMEASDGKLYGTTSAGGNRNLGVIFSFDPSNLSYIKLKDYVGENGASPGIGSAFIEIKSNNDSSHALNVNILQPINNSAYVGPAVITLIADARDPDGRITKVELYNGTTLLRTEYHSPYSWNWRNVPAGNYIITAKAYDDKDSVIISAPVPVSVFANQPPEIAISNPVNDQIIAGPATINLQAVPHDADGLITKVELYNGQVLLRTEYLPPYSWNWEDVPVGSYTIAAKAYDNKDGFTTSAPVHISIVANKAPLVNIITPLNNQIFAGPAGFTLEADARDVDGSITKVELYNGTILLRTEYMTPYSWNWKDVTAGTYTIKAKAYDDKGGITTSSPVHISVVSNKPPLIELISPENNKVIPGPANIHLLTTASDPDGYISKVQFYNKQTLLRTEYYAPFSFNWYQAPPGKYEITAATTDNLGKMAVSAPVLITLTSPGKSMARQSFINNNIIISNEASVKLSPNPAKDMLNILANGFALTKKLTMSLTSVSGVKVKSMHISPGKLTQADVSSLSPGIYFLKVAGGEKVLYNRFVKM